MDKLIERLMADAGITHDQAEKVLESIRGFVVEQFPMMAGAVDGLLQSKGKDENDPLD